MNKQGTGTVLLVALTIGVVVIALNHSFHKIRHPPLHIGVRIWGSTNDIHCELLHYGPIDPKTFEYSLAKMRNDMPCCERRLAVYVQRDIDMTHVLPFLQGAQEKGVSDIEIHIGAWGAALGVVSK